MSIHVFAIQCRAQFLPSSVTFEHCLLHSRFLLWFVWYALLCLVCCFGPGRECCHGVCGYCAEPSCFIFLDETRLTTSQFRNSQQVAEITQYFLHGWNSPIHPWSSVAQKGLSKTTGCCACQQTSPTMEPCSTYALLKQHWRRRCLSSDKGTQTFASFFGPTSSHPHSEDHEAGSASPPESSG